MPKFGSQSAAEDRLRDCLKRMLERLGYYTPEANDDQLIVQVDRIITEDVPFAIAPELDESLPF